MVSYFYSTLAKEVAVSIAVFAAAIAEIGSKIVVCWPSFCPILSIELTSRFLDHENFPLEEYDETPVAQFIIDIVGLDAFEKYGATGLTLLHVAAMMNSGKLVKTLIDRGAYIDQVLDNNVEDYSYTPLSVLLLKLL